MGGGWWRAVTRRSTSRAPSLLPSNVQSSPSAVGSLIKEHTEDDITILKGMSLYRLLPAWYNSVAPKQVFFVVEDMQWELSWLQYVLVVLADWGMIKGKIHVTIQNGLESAITHKLRPKTSFEVNEFCFCYLILIPTLDNNQILTTCFLMLLKVCLYQ